MVEHPEQAGDDALAVKRLGVGARAVTGLGALELGARLHPLGRDHADPTPCLDAVPERAFGDNVLLGDAPDRHAAMHEVVFGAGPKALLAGSAVCLGGTVCADVSRAWRIAAL